MSGPVETAVIPPEADSDDGDDDGSTRLTISLIAPDGVMHEASVHWFDGGDDPDRVAEGVLNIALALASLRGAETSWAVRQKLAAFDGISR